MPAHALLNGEPAAPQIFQDRACQFGDGLFETIAVRHARPCLWSRHLQRLQTGCQRLGIQVPDAALLLREASTLCGGRERAVLKIIISAGRSGRGYARVTHGPPTRWLACSDWPEDSPWSDDKALRVKECTTRLGTQPLLAGIKHLNRLEQVLARRELHPDQHEGVMYDQQGQPLEGIMSNLLLKYPDRYLTPALEVAGVAGTVRQLIIDRQQVLGLPLVIERLDRDALYDAEALFMSNALLGIRPVDQLEGHRYPLTHRPPAVERLHAACFTFSGEPGCDV